VVLREVPCHRQESLDSSWVDHGDDSLALPVVVDADHGQVLHALGAGEDAREQRGAGFVQGHEGAQDHAELVFSTGLPGPVESERSHPSKPVARPPARHKPKKDTSVRIEDEDLVVAAVFGVRLHGDRSRGLSRKVHFALQRVDLA